MNLITSSHSITMSSREIAELTGKEHRNVMADIRKMLVELHGEGGMLSFQHTHTNTQNGQTYPVFNLPKRESLILVSGYNVQMRAAIIDRWQSLEAQAVPKAVAIPQTLPEALRLAADLAEQKAQAEARLAIAAPKAEAFDLISASNEALTYTQAAKVLGLKRKDLVAKLHTEGWHYRLNKSWVAYDRYIKNGFLQYKEAKYTDDDTGSEVVKPYCHITQKGVTRLAAMLGKSAPAVPANLI